MKSYLTLKDNKYLNTKWQQELVFHKQKENKMGVCNIIKEQIEKNNEINKDKKIKKGVDKKSTV